MQEERFQSEMRAAEANAATPMPAPAAGSSAFAASKFGFAVPEPVPQQHAPQEQTIESEVEARDGEAVQLPQEDPMRQYCIFRAGRERFCFSILDVEEIVEWPPLTAIPLSPAFLMGIFNLRGSIVPVVDIAITEGRRVDLAPRHIVVAGLKAD